MKFGQYLLQNQYPPWQNEYLHYNDLKYFLKERQLAGWTRQDEVYFAEKLIITELDKVNAFIHLKIKQVGQDEDKISSLIDYIKLNDLGFYKILKKHDKWTAFDLLLSVRFCGIRQQFQSYITQLHQIVAVQQQQKAMTATTTTATKYWVHLDYLTQLQAILLFHLPATSTNTIHTVYFDHPTHFTLYKKLLERHEAAEIIRARWYNNDDALVYFEKKSHYESWTHNKGSYSKERFSLYTHQINQYLNLGHYNHSPESKSIFHAMQQPILRAYHHRTTYNHAEEDEYYISLDTNLTFFKDDNAVWWQDVAEDFPFPNHSRATMDFFPYAIMEIKTKSDNILPDWLLQLVQENSSLVNAVPYFSKYLHGTCHFYKDRLSLLPWWLSEMKMDIRRNKSSSYAMMSSQQQSFSAKGDGECMVIEPPLIPDYVVSPASAKIIDDDEEKRIYIHATRSSCTMVDDFTATVQQKHNSTIRPSAYDMFMNSNIVAKMRDMRPNDDIDDNIKQENHHVGMMSWLWAKITNNQTVLLSSSLPPSQKIMPRQGKLKNRKIEPKIFFANERTFISWLHFSALLMSVSLGLINFGDDLSKASGGIFIIIAIILAGYAQLRFQYRTWQIRYRGDARFDDLYGPAVLCGVLVIALIVNLGLRINQPLPEHPSPFGSSKGHLLANSSSTEAGERGTVLIIKNHKLPNGTKIDRPNGKIVQFEDGHIIVVPTVEKKNDDLED